MFVTTWLVLLFFRGASGHPFPSGKTPDINVIETEMVSVLEHWLRKIEQEAVKLFKKKSGNKTESKEKSVNKTESKEKPGNKTESKEKSVNKTESKEKSGIKTESKEKSGNKRDSLEEFKNAIRNFPSLGQDLAAARSKPESWENFEDRRPTRTVYESRTMLTSSSSQDLNEDRTRIQFMRWSQTRVYRVTSDMRKDAMQERLDQVRNSVSRVMFQIDGTRSETDIQMKGSQ